MSSVWRDICINERDDWIHSLHIAQNPFRSTERFKYWKSEYMDKRPSFGFYKDGWRDTYMFVYSLFVIYNISVCLYSLLYILISIYNNLLN